MIISRIQGGLGNQMFQYAAGRALSLRLKCPFLLDISWYSIKNVTTHRDFLLQIFPIQAQIASSNVIEKIRYAPRTLLQRILRRPLKPSPFYYQQTSYLSWDELKFLSSPAYIDGYWQNENYFSNLDARRIIRSEFRFPSLPYRAKKLLPLFRFSHDVVSVHIRRGDYVNNPIIHALHGVCSKNYYARALEYLVSHVTSPLHLLLLSDDPQWVASNFDCQGLSSTIINFPEHVLSPYHDMHIMALCKHHIIANSSFSWWGAWLSENQGYIIAPKIWFPKRKIQRDKKIQIERLDYNPCPPSWKLL